MNRVHWATRLWRGIVCWLSFLITPLGWFCGGRLIRRLEKERLERGLVLILPGIEGHSFLNVSILAGLVDAGIDYGLEVFDWTTGNKLKYFYHLRGLSRNKRVAGEIARRICDYQQQFPDRPVWIIGHSGGGGVALLTAQAMPEDRRITGLILLGPAVSPTFEIGKSARRVARGIWNFHSQLDLFFLGLATTVIGTMDGKHVYAAGAFGFHVGDREPDIDECPLIQRPWEWRMLKQFNPGDHFGCTHRVFIAEEVATLLKDPTRP